MQKARILIVDDQPANIRVMAEALGNDHDLFFATSGERALEIANGGGIDLVLLDVVMPGFDGFETCRRLKSDERTSRVPVIFVTAREETGDETRGFDVGAVDYITKPIRPAVVRARVRTQLELKQARDLLESLASIDAVTGIANRRRFDDSLAAEWKRCARTGALFGLALLDVDHFKRFNDTYGHMRGDECLRAIAAALRAVARRPGDVAARFGGEEFALIYPDADPETGGMLSRRILDNIRALEIPHASSVCPHVTVSIGSVTLRASADESPSRAVEAADALMYEAKQAGRNRAIHSDLTSGLRETIAPSEMLERAI